MNGEGISSYHMIQAMSGSSQQAQHDRGRRNVEWKRERDREKQKATLAANVGWQD